MNFYEKIIADIKHEYEKRDDILAMIVTGSVARGDAHKGNDLDILFVGKTEIPKKEYRIDGSLVEMGGNTLDVMLEKIEENPMQVYLYLDAVAIFDKGNNLQQLKKKAQDVLDVYKPTEEEIKALIKWLESVIDKITVAERNNDREKVSFAVATNLWKTVEGLYAINSIPTPAFTSALRRIHTLSVSPTNFEDIWKKILFGTLEERTENLLLLISYILPKLIDLQS